MCLIIIPAPAGDALAAVALDALIACRGRTGAAGMQLLNCSQCRKAAVPSDELQSWRLMANRGPGKVLLERQQVPHTTTVCRDTSKSQPALQPGPAVLPDCTCALLDAQEVWVAAQALLDMIRDVLPCATCKQVQKTNCHREHVATWPCLAERSPVGRRGLFKPTAMSCSLTDELAGAGRQGHTQHIVLQSVLAATLAMRTALARRPHLAHCR